MSRPAYPTVATRRFFPKSQLDDGGHPGFRSATRNRVCGLPAECRLRYPESPFDK